MPTRDLGAAVPHEQIVSPLPLPLPLPQERGRERSFLPEVQALRALAVMLVVLYHLWPDRLHGGYVGVDVFFVISGFLITSHLHRELLRRGTVSLSAFYARRARRLLPAALLVLLATVAAGLLVLPATRWAATAHDVLASTFYVQNWFLAARAVEYSASNDAASAVQHFWSLSVEEQFYLAWPSLIMVLVLASRRRGARPHALLMPGIVAVSALSLAYSVYATATDPAAAYFVTPTRIWELGAGAILALWMRDRAESAPGRDGATPVGRMIVLRWAGVAAVLGSAVLLTHASAFPGYLALAPVLGTVAVIAAGDTGRRDPLSPLITLRPTQFLGGISYALYLWHWPFIVIAPFVLARELTSVDKLVLLLACIALAWLTKVAVEDSTQRWRSLVTRPALTAALTVAAMLVVSGVAGLQLREVGRLEAAARAHLAEVQDDPCFGAAARTPEAAAAGCSDVFGPPPSPTLTPEDEPWFLDPACVATEVPLHHVTCRFGTEPPTRRVALVGDSHAEHWRGALHRIGEELNWEIVEFLKGGCPAVDVRVVALDGNPVETEDCRLWGQQIDEVLAAEKFDYIVTSSFTSAFTFEDGGEPSLEAGARGFTRTWNRWADTGARVFALRDVPTTGRRNVPECLAENAATPVECARPRPDAVVPDAATIAATRVDPERIRLLDLTDHFCDDVTCYAVVGDAIVYWDLDHMSAQFSRTLAPYLLDAMGGGLD